jgi:hypothetical protein
MGLNTARLFTPDVNPVGLMKFYPLKYPTPNGVELFRLFFLISGFKPS